MNSIDEHIQKDQEEFLKALADHNDGKVRHLTEEQLPQALAMKPDLVSILMGSNDLVARKGHPVGLAREVEVAVRALRTAGAETSSFAAKKQEASLASFPELSNALADADQAALATRGERFRPRHGAHALRARRGRDARGGSLRHPSL